MKVAAAAPRIRVADTDYNAKALVDCAKRASEEKVGVLVFPEMCMTDYTANDLLFLDSLLRGAEEGLASYIK